MREERLKRETEERKRTTSLLIQHLKQFTVCSTNTAIQQVQTLLYLLIIVQLVS